MTLAATTTRLGLGFYAYVLDRVSQANQIVPWSDLIERRAQDLALTAAWSPT